MGAPEEVFFRVEADGEAGAGAACAARSLTGGGLADAADLQCRQAGPRGVACDAGCAGVEDGVDAFDGDGAFGDVGGEDELGLGGGGDGAVLLGGGQVAVEGQDEQAETLGQGFALALGAADLGGAGEEDEGVVGFA